MTALLDISRDQFQGAYDRTPLAVRHDLVDHPLLDLSALVQLAGAHPTELVEHNVGAVSATLPGGVAPQVELSPEEVVRGIEDNGCWMVLKNVERDPRYRALLDATLSEVTDLLPRGERMQMCEGFIFVSAPGAVTPAHVDPEQNFLLQVRGTKEMNVGRFASDEIRARQLERFYAGEHRNIDALPVDASTFDLRPGDGLYVPVNAPHWVQNGDEVSISLSITFRTPGTTRQSTIWSVNHQLRARGRQPRQPGASRTGDWSKVMARRASRAVTRVVGSRSGNRAA